MKLRAEDYELEDLRELKGRFGGFDYESNRILEFLNKDTYKIFHLCSERGRGKTFLVRITLLDYSGKYMYYPYFNSRKIPKLEKIDKDVAIIIDDIHYMKDDLLSGDLKIDELIAFFEKVIKMSEKGHKFILMSEDAILPDYINDERFAELIHPKICGADCDFLGMFRTNIHAVCKNLGCKDIWINDFVDNVNPTPRGVTSFFIDNSTERDAILKNGFERYNKNKSAHSFSIGRRYFYRKPTEKDIEEITFKLDTFNELLNGRLPETWQKVVSRSDAESVSPFHIGDVAWIRRCSEYHMKELLHAMLYCCYSKDMYREQGYFRHLMRVVKGDATMRCPPNR